MQAGQEGGATFEQGADGGIVEVDGFRRRFLRPGLFQDQMAEVIDVVEVVAVQSLLAAMWRISAC